MAKRKLTAADRPQFRRDMVEMIKTLNVEVGEVAPDMVILVTRAEDFDPSENSLWELDGNKSAVRPGVVCSECKSTVVMSNHTYGRYAILDKKPRICCARCIGSLTEK